MKEYKVKVTNWCHTGLLPDFTGRTVVGYETANSAKELHEKLESELKKEFGYEIAAGKITYKIDIQRV